MQSRPLTLDASFRINEIRQTFKATATLCRFLTILHYLLWVSLVAGTNAECPVELNPQRVVVKYGSSVSVNCSTNITHKGIGWEIKEGKWSKIDGNLITWRVESLTRWDIKAMCYINYDGQCEKDLPITIYKTPDRVSINTADHTGPMTEGSTYELQCDVVNVAPVQNLIVKWYKGETLMHYETFDNTIKTPVNTTSILQITAYRSDEGVQYRCGAELELGAEGPQPPPAETSEPLNITVYFKPIINETKLPSTLSVFRGYPKVLVCEAEGKPKPEISWSKNNGMRLETPDGNLTVNEFENDDFYMCAASNSVNTTTRRVNVVIHDISISLNHSGPVIESHQYRLQCHIPNMVQATSVTWYKNLSLVHQETLNGISKTPELTIVPNRTDDGAQYRCEAELNVGSASSKQISIQVFYVSITTVNPNRPMIEFHEYRLQCHIPNMVQATSVKWYKNRSPVHQETLIGISKTPELTIVPNRTDNGAQYRCEAELNVGSASSKHISIRVFFTPTINGTNLPIKVPVFRGYPLVLVCEAEGNPKPTVSWSNTDSAVNGGNLTITELISQNPICIAVNSVGSTSRNIIVVPTEDYLPLIAGLVAITVAIISVIFLFIYSIYYKTAKMGHYSLKDAKPSPENGNIAQNGKDNPLHMKKLSQSDILAYPLSSQTKTILQVEMD